MKCRLATLWLALALVALAAASAQAAVITVTPVGRVSAPGEEPTEWELTNGWSIVTNKLGIGKITASGPSVCEAEYEPFKAYELMTVALAQYYPRWTIIDPDLVKQDLGRGAFYAAVDRFYGQSTVNDPPGITPSTVWLGTETHAGQPLAVVKLKQIKKMSYYTFVSGVPTWRPPSEVPGSDANWDSWTWWQNPRHPIQIQLLARNPSFPEDSNWWKQFWYRPWGNDAIIGDQASDGRLSIWEQHNCLADEVVQGVMYRTGHWYLPPYWEPGTVPKPNTHTYAYEYENWDTLMNEYDPEDPTQTPYGEYELIPSSEIWKSPGYKGNTDPSGMPIACTGTGKCLNFTVGARFWRIYRPHNSSKDPDQSSAWWTDALGFRGQMDYFELAIDRNNDGDVNDPGESAAYDFEPAPDDPGPTIVYLNQSSLRNSTVDKLVRKRGEPENLYDAKGSHTNNPDHDTKEWRLYDVIYKVSGRVTERFNPYAVLDDGANLEYPTRVYMVLNNRWETPTNPMQVDQHWSSWGLLERFRPVGSAPFVTKPFIVWTSKAHNRKLYP